jgi:hypothetical protein
MRVTLDPVERAAKAQASAAEREAEFEAALAALIAQPEPEDFDDALALRERLALSKARLDLARERRVAADAALADARERARQNDLITQRAKFLRDGDKRAAEWQRRWDAAGAELAAICAEIEADERAEKTLNSALAEIGGQPVRNAFHRHIAAHGLEGGYLPGETRVPIFGRRYLRHWPPARKVW